jgi:peptide/nickel transport system permease protein
MYLAGSFLMFMALLTVVGIFISDLALALLDPRIRFGAGGGK